MALPLDGVTVVSLAHQYPGPFAAMLLSDLGADVLVVERPDGGDPTRAFAPFHSALARGTRSVALDLKAEVGRAAFRVLLNGADAFLEGFRPGTMHRLGLGPESVTRECPHLVYISVSGFGQDGPDRHRSGHDLTYQAEAGMLYEHLPPAAPPSAPALALGDLSAGMFAAQAVLAGMVQRARTGRGCYVDVAMTDCLTTLLTAHLGPVVNDSGPPGFPYEPGYGVFVTADGAYLALGVAHEDHFWRALCDVTGMVADGGMNSAERFTAHTRLRAALAEQVATKPVSEWERLLTHADVPFGRLRSLAEVPSSPQARARHRFTVPLNSPTGPTVHVRQPLVVDGVAAGPRSGTPALGEHTVVALRQAGMDDITVTALLASGAAVQPRGTPNPPPDEHERPDPTRHATQRRCRHDH